MADLTVVKGDYGFNIAFTIQNSAEAAYNLSGYTITFKVWAEGSPGALMVSGDCPIDVAASGTCHYAVVSGDFKKAGIFKGELELTKTGVKESTEEFSIEVKDSG